jgi:hypothetical protein
MWQSLFQQGKDVIQQFCRRLRGWFRWESSKWIRDSCSSALESVGRRVTLSRMASSLTTVSTILWNDVGAAWNDIEMGRC